MVFGVVDRAAWVGVDSGKKVRRIGQPGVPFHLVPDSREGRIQNETKQNVKRNDWGIEYDVG